MKKSIELHNLNAVKFTRSYETGVRSCINIRFTFVSEFPQILSGMDKDIDTFETLTTSFEVVGYGVPRPTVAW